MKLSREVRNSAWLAALVVLSIVVRYVLARQHPVPWILDDELIHIELAKGLFAGDAHASRGAGSALGRLLYVTLIAPAYSLWWRPTTAYVAIKLGNCMLMSLAAVPTYYLARRSLAHWPALAASALALLVPSMAYTAAVMTENAFYPVFLVGALAYVRMLEQPTAKRQVIGLLATLLAVLTRTQAVVLIPALLFAILSDALLRARAERLPAGAALRRLGSTYRATWIALGATVLAAAVAWIAADLGSESDGATEYLLYRKLLTESYFWSRVPERLFVHLAGLNLYVGVAPFAAFLVLAFRDLRSNAGSGGHRAETVVPLWVTSWMLLLVTLYVAFVQQHRIQERNFFVVAPFFLIAYVRWVSSADHRRSAWVAVTCLACGVLPVLVTLAELEGIETDTFALVWALRAREWLGNPSWAFCVLGSLALSLSLLLPRRSLRLSAVLFALLFAASNVPVLQATVALSKSSLVAGTDPSDPTWIDDAVGRDAHVAAIWTGTGSVQTLWQNEFFSRSLSSVFHHLDLPPPDRLRSTPLATDPETGLLVDVENEPIAFEYVLTQSDAVFEGRRVAEDPERSMVLYAIDGPAHLLSLTSGVQPDDWTGRVFAQYRHARTPGLLVLDLESDSSLFPGSQELVARLEDGSWEQRFTLRSGQRRLYVAALPPRPTRLLAFSFEVDPTAVPAQVLDSNDERELGIVCRGISFEERPLAERVALRGIRSDRYSKESFQVTVFADVPGDLTLELATDAEVFPEGQLVTVRSAGMPEESVRLDPGSSRTVRIPLESSQSGFRQLEFTVRPTVDAGQWSRVAGTGVAGIRVTGVHFAARP